MPPLISLGLGEQTLSTLRPYLVRCIYLVLYSLVWRPILSVSFSNLIRIRVFLRLILLLPIRSTSKIAAFFDVKLSLLASNGYGNVDTKMKYWLLCSLHILLCSSKSWAPFSNQRMEMCVHIYCFSSRYIVEELPSKFTTNFRNNYFIFKSPLLLIFVFCYET